MVLVIVGRDVLVTVLRIIADRKRQPVVTSRLAKWKTALQLIFLWYIVAAYAAVNVAWLNKMVSPSLEKTLFSPWIIESSMILLTALSIITAVQYLIENRHVLPFVSRHLARTTS
jgi:CDP-diacylglycerol--glycerol-3-phosphate 3-phosphatidyltransferase